ncbi:hypothetical protein [Azospirillum endophyticum]
MPDRLRWVLATDAWAAAVGDARSDPLRTASTGMADGAAPSSRGSDDGAAREGA